MDLLKKKKEVSNFETPAQECSNLPRRGEWSFRVAFSSLNLESFSSAVSVAVTNIV